MKKHTALIICFLIFGTVMTVVLFCVGCAEQVELAEESAEPEPLVIDIPEPETEGLVTVYDDETGEVAFQYGGEILIVNDGKDGQEIEIEVHLPSTGCTCEEGW